MGERFFRSGYNVLIPRLPGHGHAGNWNRKNPPPLPTDAAVYQQFGLEWLKQAQRLSNRAASPEENRVIVSGLSGGGALTAWLALQQPQAIDRALLFAAYLSSSSKLVDLVVRSSDRYFEWTQDGSGTPCVRGYKGFAFPALRALLDLGRDVLHRAKQHPPSPPMFILSSESDIAVSSADHKALSEDLLPHQPVTWYHRFSRALDIPHTMMTQAEGNPWAGVLNSMAKAFVESNLTWAEVEEIGYRMTDGKTFNTVVAELGLQQNVSPDMPAMMTMVDKRSIVEARNPNYSASGF
ncbi:alpha/beta fold hydrolase, partial [Leptolyngbya sp. FACHB-36]|uniref:alpha/beta hydrolase n=1 Tax=Leptolyngbya sp. FACHB-36 TaxID=2692808 RepID=UPI0016816195